MSKHLKSVAALTIICIVTSILLAFTNKFTAPVIKKQEDDAITKALSVVLPSGEDFKTIEIGDKLPATITEAYTEKNGGYVFKLNITGYKPSFIILCGINKDGVVTGATTISSNETLGYEKTYGDKLKNATAESIDSVDTISGATKTTLAFKNAVKDSLNAFIILNGGTADLRSEEEILANNLSAVLPDANGEFEAVIMPDELKGIDKVYKALNGKGFALVIGKEFIGADSNGKLITKTDNKDIAEAAAKDVAKFIKSQIDIKKLNLPSSVKRAYKTADNEFTLILHAAGYGVNGGDKYTEASGEPIVIMVTLTADGKIVSCKTVSSAETPDLGGVCEKQEFYSQFNGKTENDYKNIDVINGATVTTNGYIEAIGESFAAVKILKGVS